MAETGNSDAGVRGDAGDALTRLRTQVLARWNAFPDALRDELDALLAARSRRQRRPTPKF